MLLEPWQDIGEVEDCAVVGANRMRERLKGHGAEVEGEAFEGGTVCFVLRDSRASAGGIGVFRGPFRVGDLG